MGDLPPLTRACTRACSAFPPACEQQTRQHTCTRPRRVAGALQLLPEDGADKGRAMHDGVTPVQIAMHCVHCVIEIMTKKMSAMLLLRLVSGGPVEDTSSFRYTPTSLRILVHFSGHYGALSNTCARAAARRPASLAPWAQK